MTRHRDGRSLRATREGGHTLKPYFQQGGVTLYLGDCREVLPTLGLQADVCIADPPYEETALGWDITVDDWLPAVRRALGPAPSLWCFGSFRAFMESGHAFRDWRLAQDIVWEKHNGSGFAADRFRRVHELVAHFYPRDVAWGAVYHQAQKRPGAKARKVKAPANRAAHTGKVGASTYETKEGGLLLERSVQRVRSCHGTALHPTQKPEALLALLVRYSCPPAGLVLDPFVGSGSVLAAARREGRRAVGVERSERYCEAAAQRLSQQVLELGA